MQPAQRWAQRRRQCVRNSEQFRSFERQKPLYDDSLLRVYVYVCVESPATDRWKRLGWLKKAMLGVPVPGVCAIVWKVRRLSGRVRCGNRLQWRLSGAYDVKCTNTKAYNKICAKMSGNDVQHGGNMAQKSFTKMLRVLAFSSCVVFTRPSISMKTSRKWKKMLQVMEKAAASVQICSTTP